MLAEFFCTNQEKREVQLESISSDNNRAVATGWYFERCNSVTLPPGKSNGLSSNWDELISIQIPNTSYPHLTST